MCERVSASFVLMAVCTTVAVPGLSAAATISGTKFEDLDQDGFSVGDPPLEGVFIQVFLDDGDGSFEPGGDDGPPLATEVSAVDGTYSFTGLGLGRHFVREDPDALVIQNLLQTDGGDFFPAVNFYTVNITSAGDAIIGRDFANFVLGDPDLDFGDAPDPTYPTLLASNGARHALSVGGLMLGTAIDFEADGRPSVGADGDDTDVGDDEEGVVLTSGLRLNVLPTITTVNVSVSAPGVLNAWVDFSRDGDWADLGEGIFTDQVVAGGDNALTFPVPPEAVLGSTYARFRLSSAGGLLYDGAAIDGEVEDYLVEIVPDDDLDLFNMILAEDRDFFACNSITLGGALSAFPDLSILAPAKIHVSAGNAVVFKDGLFVEQGAELTAAIGAIAGCP